MLYAHYDPVAYTYLFTTVRTDGVMCALVTLDSYFQCAQLVAVHSIPLLQSGILALSTGEGVMKGVDQLVDSLYE